MNLPWWFYCIEWLLYSIYFVVDWPKSRHRKLTYSLCERHRRQRWMMFVGWPLSASVGIALLGVGIFSSAPMYIGLPATILGLGLIVVAPLLHKYSPGPRLTGEGTGFLWISGAGETVLAAHAERNVK